MGADLSRFIPGGETPSHAYNRIYQKYATLCPEHYPWMTGEECEAQSIAYANMYSAWSMGVEIRFDNQYEEFRDRARKEGRIPAGAHGREHYNHKSGARE